MSRCNQAEQYYDSFFPDGLKMCGRECECESEPVVNIVKDYRTLENQQDPGMVSLRQNINTRHIRIENSSTKDVLIGINTYSDYRYRPKPQFLLRGGEVRDLAINMPGQISQWIWMYSPITGRVLGDPHITKWFANTYVIREGENRFWLSEFNNRGYNAQH